MSSPQLIVHLISQRTAVADVHKSQVFTTEYRSGTVNSNTVKSKFDLIRSFFEIFTTFLSFHV